MSYEDVKRISTDRREQFANDARNPQQLSLIADEIRARIGNTKRDIFEIGRLLTKAKQLVPHGEFKTWIKDNFDFSYQTANNFMNVYACCLNKPQLVNTIPASVLYTIASPKFPNDLREYLFKHGDYLEKLTNKDIKEIYGKYKEGEIGLDSPEIKALVKYNRESKKLSRHQKQIDENIAVLEKLRDTVLKMRGEIKWPVMLQEEQTEVTKDQQEKIESIIKDMADAVAGTRPKYRIVESLKPKLEEDVVVRTPLEPETVETLRKVLKKDVVVRTRPKQTTIEKLKTVLEEDTVVTTPLKPKSVEILRKVLKVA